jgi:hypothetical protein
VTDEPRAGAQAPKKREYSIVHIRNQQRNGRKSLTTVAGLASDLDLQKILKCMRKVRIPLYSMTAFIQLGVHIGSYYTFPYFIDVLYQRYHPS